VGSITRAASVECLDGLKRRARRCHRAVAAPRPSGARGGYGDGLCPPSGWQLVLCVLAALVTLAALLPADAGAPSRPAPGETVAWAPSALIAFGNRAGGIYVVRPDGSGLRRLTSLGNGDSELAFSPDGKTLLFAADLSLYSVRIDGGGLRRLGPGYGAAWSPDGARIAVARADGIYLMNADGSRARKLVTNRYTEVTGGPAWSPDGRQLAYVACTAPFLSQPCEHQYGFDVYVIGADGSGRHRITPSSDYPQCPAWSSAGVLAFLNGRSVAVLQRRTGRLRTFQPGGCPHWSPDGRRFVLALDRGLAFLNSDGSGRQAIRLSPALAVAWSPDERSLAVISVGRSPLGRSLSVIRADGTLTKRVL
jgi:Tol biopolymer transport system component